MRFRSFRTAGEPAVTWLSRLWTRFGALRRWASDGPAIGHNRPPRPQPAVSSRQRGADIEETGRWYFKRDILDRLDEHFTFAEQLRRSDREGYQLCAKLGAVVAGPGTVSFTRRLSARWKEPEGHMAFGAVSLCKGDGNKDWVPARFIYFRKMTRPKKTVERSIAGETVYECTSFLSDYKPAKHKKHLQAYVVFHVAVDLRAEARLLREVNSIKGRRRHKSSSLERAHGAAPWSNDAFVHSWYGWPMALDAYVKGPHQDGEKPEEHLFPSHEAAAVWLFGYAAGVYENASMDIRVRAAKGPVIATFCVDLLRTPYFFKDRDFEANAAGSRKRIFHIVRVHERHMASGEVRYVRSHFRGARRFTWNDYEVNITMPGKHHPHLLDATFGAEDMPADEPCPSGMIETSKIAKLIDRGTNV